MKIYAPQHFSLNIILCLNLLQLSINFVSETDAKLGHVGWAKSDSRTKQLLQNIRLHRAQQAEEEQQLQQCDPKLPSCKIHPQEEDSVEEIPQSDRFLSRRKPTLPVKTKDTSRTSVQKDRRSLSKSIKQEDASEVKKREKDHEAKRPQRKWIDETSEEEKEETGKRKEYKELKEITRGKKEDDVKSEYRRKTVDDKSIKSQDKEYEEPKPSARRKREEDDKDAKSQDKRVKEEVKLELKLKKTEPKKSKEEPVISTKVDKNRKEEKDPGKPLGKSLTKPKTFDKPKSVQIKKETIKDKKIIDKKNKTEESTLRSEKRIKPKSYTKREGVRFPDDIPVFSLTSDFVKSEQCKKHSRIYMRQLERYKLWALMMYDASAKLPAGILQGNVNQYGDFDQCISINATFKKRSHNGISGIQGKYCLATVDISSDSQDTGLQQAIHRSQSFGFVKSKISDQPGHFIPRFSTVNWGLCIPSACNAQDLENSIKESLRTYKKNAGLIFNVKVEGKNCVTKKDLLSEYEMKTFIALSFYAIILGIAIYATLHDVFHKKPKLRRNAESEDRNIFLLDDDSTAGEANETATEDESSEISLRGESEGGIHCIHGIKSIFTMMLYFAHKTIPLALTPFSNRIVLTEISNEASSILLRGSIMYTDSFLLISGVLTAFNLGKEIQRKGRILWIRRLVARYIRLTPALLATLLIYAYVSNCLGSGPMWNTVVKENSALCQRYMWRNLLYIQNFYPFEEMCAPQTHQLALDMQLYLFSPLAVYFLHEYDKIGIGILQALLLISSILRFTTTTNNKLSVIIFHGMSVSQLYKTANSLYIQAIHRATPYIIGIMIGYYLQKAGKKIVLPKILVISGWITSLSFLVLSFVNPAHLAYKNYEYNVTEAAHYAALSPIAWSLALGWVITACYLGYGGKFNEYLSSKGLLIFSRISYSVYLVQFLVFSHFVGTKRVPEVFSISGSFNVTEFMIVIILSIVVTLLFDIPTIEIKHIALNKQENKVPTEQYVTATDRKDGSDNAGTCNVKKVDLIPEMEYENDKGGRDQQFEADDETSGNDLEDVEYEDKGNSEEVQELNYYPPEEEEAEFAEEEVDQEENEMIDDDFWGEDKD